MVLKLVNGMQLINGVEVSEWYAVNLMTGI